MTMQKQRHPRIKTNFKTTAKQVRRLMFEGRVLNLSEGGAFLETKEKLIGGQEVILFLNLPIQGQEKPCMVQGKVAWSNYVPTKGAIGCGVAFCDVATAAARHLRDFVSQNMSQKVDVVGATTDDKKGTKPPARGQLRGWLVKLELKELSPSLWTDLEKLFGSRGACGGCWCMSWRHPKGEKWSDVKGPTNKRRFKKLVLTRKAHGALAYADGEPVGWVSFDRRRDYARLDRAPSLACDDADQVWSIPCFFIRSGFRGKGVGAELLRFALKCLKRHGAKIVEGYPVKPYGSGGPIPAAFAWTGTPPMFEKAGFKLAGSRTSAKLRMRRAP
jgi:Tfp pilus assembly protein PilZ/GNAT superfamily N-acetyltransferase